MVDGLAGRNGELTFDDGAQTTSGPALAYLSGETNAEQLLAAAGDVPGLRCEFAFLIALREFGRGNRETGIAALRTCVNTGIFRYLEHRLGQVMLKRAQADPTWPAWHPKGR